MQIERRDGGFCITLSDVEAKALKTQIEEEAPAIREGWLTSPADPGDNPLEEVYGLLDSEIGE